MEDSFSHRLRGSWFWDESSTLHLFCTLFLFVYIAKILLYFLLQVLKLAINIWFINPSGVYFVYGMTCTSVPYRNQLFPRGHLYHLSSFRAGVGLCLHSALYHWLCQSLRQDHRHLSWLCTLIPSHAFWRQAPLLLTSALAILALCLSIQIWGYVCQVSLQAKLNQIKCPTRRIFFLMVWWLILLPPNEILIRVTPTF